MSSTRHIPVAEAGDSVHDVMLFDPRTVPPDTPVAQVRETFANPHVKLILVAQDGRFLGTLAREDLPETGDGTVAAFVRRDTPRVRSDDPTARAMELVETTGLNRIPVVDEDDALQGLVCFNARRSAFCASP